ncbi:MAG: hypothetical protein WC558_14060 [Patulibacter sp.]
MAVLLAVLCTASPAVADYRDVYKQCESGTLTTKFSARDLQQASQRMSSYLRDYTNCSDAIYQAQTNAERTKSGRTGSGGGSGSSNGGGSTSGGGGSSTGSGGSGSGGGSTTGGGSGGSTGSTATPSANLTPDEKYVASQAALQQADAAGSLEQMLAAAKIPSSALTYSSASAPMPVSLVIALVASGVLALLAAVLSLLARFRRTRVD